MKQVNLARFFLLGCIGCVILLFTAESAFSEGFFRGSGYRRPLVQNQLYKDECGSCHWAFLPQLLPSGSWNTLMDGLENHFGEDATLAPEDEKAIRSYLASTSRSRMWGGNDSIIRITEMPGIRGSHRGIDRWIAKYPQIKSFSNCTICHKGADYGIFGDD